MASYTLLRILGSFCEVAEYPNCIHEDGNQRPRHDCLFRLLATAGSWFLWDFSFYGNKVFQSAFIQILSPGASLLTTLLWTLLNSGCALVGYWVSACLVDNPKVSNIPPWLLDMHETISNMLCLGSSNILILQASVCPGACSIA